MKPRKTKYSNGVFELEGGNEDNSLWVERTIAENGDPVIISTWELNEEEKKAVVDGKRIQLIVWGTGHPPVAMRLEEEDENG